MARPPEDEAARDAERPGHAPPDASRPERTVADAAPAPAPAAAPSPRPAWRWPAWLVFGTATFAALGGFVLVYVGLVRTEAGQRLENEALLAATLTSPDDVALSLERLSIIGVVSVAVAVALLVLVALARRRFGLAVAVGAATLGAVVAAEILKDVLPRPELVSGPGWLLRNSFPSGHATIAAAVALGALLVVPDRLRWLALPAGAIATVAIGQATQATGWHRMSCALGGVLLATAGSAAAVTALSLAGLVQPGGHGRIHPRIRAGLVVAAGAAAALAAIVLIVGAAFPILRAPEGASGAFLHTALSLVGAGISVLVLTGFAVLLEPYTIGAGPDPAPATSRSGPGAGTARPGAEAKDGDLGA